MSEVNRLHQPVDETSDAATKGERTRKLLLDIAIEQFGNHGYRRTSVSEICRRAGLTQAASYAYFDDKEHLFRAAVDADARALVEQARERTAATPVRQLIPAFLTSLAADLGNHPLARRVLAGLEPEAMGRLQQIETVERVHDDLAERLARGQEAGEVRSDIDPGAIARGSQTILLSLLMSMTQWNTAPDPDDGPGAPTPVAEEVIVGVLAVFDAMLAPAPPEKI
jgi:AcrR family transcriptional regulator